MNRIFLCLLLGAFFFFSCGNSGNLQAANDHGDDPMYKKGLALVGKNKCFSCHAINEAISGPAYSEIGKKYENASDSMVSALAAKVITGGTGIWGSAIMIPHPGVTRDEAEAMVRYILILGKDAK